MKSNPSGVFRQKCLRIVEQRGVRHGGVDSWCDGQLKIDLFREDGVLIVTEHVPLRKKTHFHPGWVKVAIGSMFGSEFTRVRRKDLRRLSPIVNEAVKLVEATA